MPGRGNDNIIIALLQTYVSTLPVEAFQLSLPDFAILGKTLHELRKIFVEHARHVAGL